MLFICVSLSSFYRQQNSSRKRLKRALKYAADKCDGISPDRTDPFTEDAQTEEMHEVAQHFHNNVEVSCQTKKVSL